MSERWTAKELLHWQKTGEEPGRASTVRPANLESSVSNEPTEPDEGEEVHQKCHITVHCYRTKPADPDNCCGKWAIDTLVNEKIITDDSRKYVEVTFKETKCNHYYEERTELILNWE